ncbi:hypothetical protein IRJ41_009241 [Triplophysa rosa]|uniref:Interleukin-7 n=1 Tax=Triplophysa rosa TaxID=992332 RepID=A0A9W7T9B3_TRIRA|nr:hypothetical protein IRJ41_009241 [Triplophysa rosa]
MTNGKFVRRRLRRSLRAAGASAHLLGASVLTLVILPLAFSCESADISNKVAEDYRNVIEPRLKHVEAIIDQLNLNCTSKKLRQPKNAQVILRKICRVNRQLRKQSENETRQAIPVLPLLVEEIDHSLQCWCLKKKKKESSKPSRKWKLCKVKHILSTLQTYFEQYNASQSVHSELQKRGKPSHE